jgi:hypothetical protein
VARVKSSHGKERNKFVRWRYAPWVLLYRLRSGPLSELRLHLDFMWALWVTILWDVIFRRTFRLRRRHVTEVSIHLEYSRPVNRVLESAQAILVSILGYFHMLLSWSESTLAIIMRAVEKNGRMIIIWIQSTNKNVNGLATPIF